VLPVAFVAAALAVVAIAPASMQRPAQPSRRIELVDGREAAAGEAIAKFQTAYPADITAAVDLSAAIPLPARAHRIKSRGRSTAELLAILRARRDVVYAEPNYVVRGSAVPNDPQVSNAWFLHNPSSAHISAVAAWDVTTGSKAHVIGVVDSGIDHSHQDLIANLWTAPSAYRLSIGGSTLDCPAGSHGFDAFATSCSAVDGNGHGTGMAGAMGAVGNNAIGTAGVNWHASLMDLRFLGPDNTGFISDAINAIDAGLQLKQIFGAAADVRVLSNSWGTSGYSQALHDVLAKAADANVLIVASAMNNSQDNDAIPAYPASFDIPNLIAVAATTPSDLLSSYSNYGAATVDLGAPGDSILTTTRSNTYGFYTGTSPAAAIVSGVAGLVLSACAVDAAGVKEIILQTVDPVPALSGRTVTGGRVNANSAVRQCAAGNQAPDVAITTPVDDAHFTAPATITIAASASDADGYVTKVDFYANGAYLATDSNAPYSIVSNGVSAGTYDFSVIATDNQGGSTISAAVRVVVDPAQPALPSPWGTQDIGQTGVTGFASHDGGVFTVRGGGADVWGTADAFRYVYQPLTGDGVVIARVASLQNVAAWTKAGVMIRETLGPSSAHAFMLASAGRGLAFQRRASGGGTSTSTSGGAGTAPAWLRLARAGPTITASWSADGRTWTTVGQDTIAMAATVYVGLAISSHDVTRLAEAMFDSVAIVTASPPPPPPAPALPAGWDHVDIGSVGVAGTASENGGLFTIEGAGADVWGTADAFQYAYVTLSGDATVVARVASVEFVAAWTKAGVMIRESLDPRSPHAFMLVSAGKGVSFQRRVAAGGLSASTSGGAGAAPRWVRLARAGQRITASVSTDGSAWIVVGQETFTMGAPILVGLAVSSHDPARLAEATFDNVSISGGPLPPGWSSSGVGAVGVAGAAREAAGTFTVSGAGADVWGAADAFHYAYRAMSGDGEIVARVGSVEAVAAWTKAGVMIRESLDPGSPHAFMVVSAGKGLAFQRRTAGGGLTTSTGGGPGTAPRWIRLTRAGQTITASISPDGAAWTVIGQDTFAMGTDVLVGFAVSSHDTTRLATATFSSVTIAP
jgi:regulation of enolase protein 1 (concanavalin A-like superfamily)